MIPNVYNMLYILECFEANNFYFDIQQNRN